MRWKASLAISGEAITLSRREDSGESPAAGGNRKNAAEQRIEQSSPRQHQLRAQAAERRGAEFELAAEARLGVGMHLDGYILFTMDFFHGARQRGNHRRDVGDRADHRQPRRQP